MNIVAKIVSPTEPPIWRRNELRPAASAMRWRSTFESAAVVSGTNRHANATPVTTSGRIICVDDVWSVMCDSW